MNELFELIKQKIRENNGLITFERFMEMCLYEPKLGYYERNEGIIGKKGDYITSVSVGSIFGYLLAFRFNKWFSQFKTQNNGINDLYLIETGANGGLLAVDILTWFQNYNKNTFNRIKYLIIEPSVRRREWQKQNTKNFSEKILWFDSLNDAHQSLSGNTFELSAVAIIFSNELLDSFPVHRLVWDAKLKRWFEIGICLGGDCLKYIRIDLSDECLGYVKKIDETILEFIPDGFSFEISLKALDWWKNAGEFLKRGKLVAIDYGYTTEGILNPLYIQGTFRGYSRHHINDEWLKNPGYQDLTADVNFSLVIEKGESAGLKTEFFGTQEEFFISIVKEFDPERLPDWFRQNLSKFKTLIHPDHFGRQMKVLVQYKN
ncbi:MAG: class I SAM-dependent methyltransferase [Verrucomicrobiia bacterium]|jgi:SAM-dependent MidA family methyltransferase